MINSIESQRKQRKHLTNIWRSSWRRINRRAIANGRSTEKKKREKLDTKLVREWKHVAKMNWSVINHHSWRRSFEAKNKQLKLWQIRSLTLDSLSLRCCRFFLSVSVLTYEKELQTPVKLVESTFVYTASAVKHVVVKQFKRKLHCIARFCHLLFEFGRRWQWKRWKKEEERKQQQRRRRWAKTKNRLFRNGSCHCVVCHCCGHCSVRNEKMTSERSKSEHEKLLLGSGH